jgi:nickel/cobalt exporter
LDHAPLTHSHGGRPHSHLPPGADGQGVTWRSLLALGVSGGLLPCPAALVVLLGAIALHRVAFGLLLIVAFSVGLAAVLTGIGLLLVYARRSLQRLDFGGPVARLLPVASALVIVVAGLAITLQALPQAL